MSQITTTNRQAILALIAAADETTEVNSIESRLESLEDFILTDAPSGVATFSASASITSTVTDGIGTQSTILVQAAGITSTSTDGVNTTTEGITPTSYSITTPTTLYSAQQSGDLELRADGGLTLYGDYQANQNNIAIQSNQIVSTVGDGTNTNYVSVSPNILDITFTDGTKSNTIYSEYNDLTGNHLIEMNVNNGSSLSSAIVLGQNNITGLSNIILDAGDKNYDATTYSQVSIANDYVKQEVINGNITSTFLIDPLGKIDQTKLEETNGTDTTYIRIGADNFTISTDTGTTANQIATSINNISLSSTDGVDNKIIEITPTYINITGLQSFDDDDAAGTGGLAAGSIYQTTGLGASPLDVAGILMIKQ